MDARSEKSLQGVHPDLVAVVRRAHAVSPVNFIVTEGLRTPERQRELFNAGATKTLRSRHLTGHAVDLAAKVGNEVRWDWPLYEQLALAMKAAAEELGVPVEWGGDWPNFRDGPHFQLPWKDYP
ncbi:M15 family metallopeptidase [Roseococcus microcysteis]|uniref:M15 family metallopeptidase n=1 Tax=Roseococcus microcysteis TaxID=2771361 RepID=UPI00168A4AA0|nr:M15 family metallopeptidase [Roseococcus microcysteis]